MLLCATPGFVRPPGTKEPFHTEPPCPGESPATVPVCGDPRGPGTPVPGQPSWVSAGLTLVGSVIWGQSPPQAGEGTWGDDGAAFGWGGCWQSPAAVLGMDGATSLQAQQKGTSHAPAIPFPNAARGGSTLGCQAVLWGLWVAAASCWKGTMSGEGTGGWLALGRTWIPGSSIRARDTAPLYAARLCCITDVVWAHFA